jgi:hypothetical protein
MTWAGRCVVAADAEKEVVRIIAAKSAIFVLLNMFVSLG